MLLLLFTRICSPHIGVFVPHGQCTDVHLGGHIQTGGYGQLGRSFGLIGDHVRALEIIDHASQEQEITRESDPEQFYAWLGGSPGNMGVLTHVTLEVHRDSDYVGSMGLKVVHLYEEGMLKVSSKRREYRATLDATSTDTTSSA
jgi:FAD/FMN-containing dehydrogenase